MSINFVSGTVGFLAGYLTCKWVGGTPGECYIAGLFGSYQWGGLV